MKSPLLQLPVEIKIAIFQHLPATVILRCQRVCKELRDCIDTNKSNLASVIRKIELARLVVLPGHCTHQDVEFMGAFEQAIDRWSCLRRGSQTVALAFLGFSVGRFEMQRFARKCSELHAAARFCRTPGGNTWNTHEALCQEIVDSVPSGSRDITRELCESIIYDTTILGGIVHVLKAEAVLDNAPSLPLTLLWADGHTVKEGICSEQRLVHSLGVPRFPENRRVAYCARHEGTVEAVKDAVRRSWRSLDPLIEAAVLEDLFVY